MDGCCTSDAGMRAPPPIPTWVCNTWVMYVPFVCLIAHLSFSGEHFGKWLSFPFKISDQLGKDTEVFLGSAKIFSFEKQES